MKNLKKRTCIVITAQYIPTLPISSPIYSNLFYNGVVSTFYTSLDKILPTQLCYPTTITTNHPSPVTIEVPDSKIGEGIS